ncbi:hypothetical protein BpHYR1_029276, partial [Brachionus plicatilis]
MEEAFSILEDWPTVPGESTDTLKKMHKYVMALVSIVKAQKDQIKEMATEIADLKANPVTNNPAPTLSWASVISNKHHGDDCKREKGAQRNRKNPDSVVISGAGYSESEDTDKERVNEVLEVLNLDRDQVKYQRRIKSANGSRLDKIVVTFKETKFKQQAISKSKDLKDRTGFEQVYVNSDKTQCKRVLERNLRGERNRRNQELKGGTEGRHRYGIKSSGQYEGKKFSWGIRWDDPEKFISPNKKATNPKSKSVN